jgi:hypothetical protein
MPRTVTDLALVRPVDDRRNQPAFDDPSGLEDVKRVVTTDATHMLGGVPVETLAKANFGHLTRIGWLQLALEMRRV